MWQRCSSSDTSSSWFWMVEVKFTNFCDPFATRSSAGTSDSGKGQSDKLIHISPYACLSKAHTKPAKHTNPHSFNTTLAHKKPPHELPLNKKLETLIRNIIITNFCKCTQNKLSGEDEALPEAGGAPPAAAGHGAAAEGLPALASPPPLPLPRGDGEGKEGGRRRVCPPARPPNGGSRAPPPVPYTARGGQRCPGSRLPSKRGSGLSSGNSMAGGGARGPAALGGNPPRHMPGAGVPASGPAFVAAL